MATSSLRTCWCPATGSSKSATLAAAGKQPLPVPAAVDKLRQDDTRSFALLETMETVV